MRKIQIDYEKMDLVGKKIGDFSIDSDKNIGF